MTPFAARLFLDSRDTPTTGLSASSDAVPNGKLLIVEHISGYFVVGAADPVDSIWVADEFGQEVNLPTHFESRTLNFGGALGLGKYHQFGSPVKMYVSVGRITINGDANTAGMIFASVIGHLIDS